MAGVQLTFKRSRASRGNSGRSGPAMIQPKPGADGHGTAHKWPRLMAEGEQEFHGPNQVGILTKQALALPQRLTHQANFSVFQVSQPAVNDAGGAAGGAGSKIFLLHDH